MADICFPCFDGRHWRCIAKWGQPCDCLLCEKIRAEVEQEEIDKGREKEGED